MAYIQLPEGLPGIVGPMPFRPKTAEPLNELAEVLLQGPSTLSRGERVSGKSARGAKLAREGYLEPEPGR